MFFRLCQPVVLQRSRRSGHAPRRRASTEPPFITAERARRRAHRRLPVLASTEPPFITAERSTGRCPRCQPCCCFNGAAVHHGGEDEPRDASPAPRSSLQRSRRSSRRRGAASERSVLRARGASTEPPFITAERACKPADDYLRRRRFNGAAVHHGGEGERAPWRHDGRTDASTEPPFITAERARARAGARPCRRPLQRSRRSSRRRGPRRRSFAIGATWRFNGAAVHHGGEADERRPGGHPPPASTEPPFITAERFETNVQVLIQDAWLQRSRRSSRRRGILRIVHLRGLLQASTEPPFITAERKPPMNGGDLLHLVASTEPPFITAERRAWS